MSSVAQCFSNPELLSQDSISKLSSEYAETVPFKHAVLDNLFNDELLRNVRMECLTQLHATLKETDIYKVWQTGDLKNIDGLDNDEKEKLKHLMQLRACLYSEQFRSFISSVTGCGELAGDKFDLSVNVYRDGGHLLCHDDVIGTRRIAYIIYLTNPDEPWKESQGGQLELYAVKPGTNQPEHSPCKTVGPVWNRLAMFNVVPGTSFHSVREVVNSEMHRVSITGWLHRPETEIEADRQEEERPEEVSHSCEMNGSEFRPFESIDSASEDITLTEEDCEYLSKYLNKTYLNGKTLGKVAASLAEQGSLQLHKFFRPEFFKKISKALPAADKKDGLSNAGLFKNLKIDYSAGVRPGWEVVGTPYKCRFTTITDEVKASSECEVMHEIFDFMNSEAFGKLVGALTQMSLVSRRGIIRRFRPGLDYTMAVGVPQEDAIIVDAFWTYVHSEDLWSAGDVGGYTCYMFPDAQNEDAAMYRVADEGEEDNTICITPVPNALSLVVRGGDMMKFTKYVSRKAPGSRWEAAFEFVAEADNEH
eukprot:TRINITY_DN1765_c0_g1_i1.p1 TRINITY_DN1765_c0_g1~~TRINITY_DN1765_c0_g1_i1.p1  ORF type:complete len:544 (-),score=136.51 TRINITY_DN1765_c0_g1_i1:97-1698(-)